MLLAGHLFETPAKERLIELLKNKLLLSSVLLTIWDRVETNNCLEVLLNVSMYLQT